MNNPQVADFMAFIPEIFLAVCAMVLLVSGVIKRPLNQGSNDVKSFNFVMFLSIVALAITAFLSLVSVQGDIFNNQLSISHFSQYMKVVCIISATAVLFVSRGWLLRHNMYRFEYAILVLLAVLGMMIMLSARHLLLVYLGLELQSLALYVLAASKRNDGRASEAGLKYFILGAISSGILLYGMSMLYGASGGLSYDIIISSIAEDSGNKLALTAMVLMIIAIAFKISAVPFHMWTPDVYDGAPVPVTAFFAVAPKIAAFGLLIVLLGGPFALISSDWMPLIAILSALSMIIGSVAAIAQSSLKRLMAYSSIGHIGYALIAVASGVEGFKAAILYLTIYAVMNVGVFAILMGLSKNGKSVDQISDLSGFSKTHVLLAACMAILMFSMAGIPPMLGFAGKLAVFQAALNTHIFGLLILAIVGILTSAISAYYYLRIIKVMYFDSNTEKLDDVSGFEIKTIAMVAAVAMAVMLPAAGILINLINGLI